MDTEVIPNLLRTLFSLFGQVCVTGLRRGLMLKNEDLAPTGLHETRSRLHGKHGLGFARSHQVRVLVLTVSQEILTTS